MLRRSTDELVIRPRLSSTWRMVLVVLAILVVIAASFAGYWGGRQAVYEQLDSRAREIGMLEGELRESRKLRRDLEAELQSTRDRLDVTREQLEETTSSLTKVTRQLQIDKSAYSQLREELESSNERITELASELKFYRSIISPADGRSGVRIQSLQLQPTGSTGEYRYRLILIQALEHGDSVEGAVRFEVNGTEDGGSRTIRVPDGDAGGIPADFKYFQNFAGTFQLPAGFMPAEITVIFEGQDDAVVERLYPWPERETISGP